MSLENKEGVLYGKEITEKPYNLENYCAVYNHKEILEEEILKYITSLMCVTIFINGLRILLWSSWWTMCVL